ncbi:kelch-like protein 29 [Anneissia japonica]|uniref:kelch-like protein 29 n=1 Tax=Anneissia japonica TaxID=1529436 RepID=UPI0014259481|nr:kelch-like protein 29 [Anneissia japonica]XP_033104538.1 kelch-like protein 29 [Anneissia japonica]XP_033104539.1 kelch-like protein 29 [Anneissia japonica]
MGCCSSCRHRSKLQESENPMNSSLQPIPEENAFLPLEAMTSTPGLWRDTRDGYITGSNLSISKKTNSNLSIALKRMSGASFYRLAKGGSDYNLTDDEGSVWTLASSTMENPEVDDPDYAAEVLASLHLGLMNGLYTDFTISTRNQQFHCHKAILAAASRFFSLLFYEKRKENGKTEIVACKPIDFIDLSNIAPPIMLTIIEYIYTAKLIISLETVHGLLVAAQQFQLNSAEEACREFIDKLDISSRLNAEEMVTRIQPEYTFKQPFHVNEILLGLNDQRIDKKFTDITICVEDQDFACHRIVLATIHPSLEEKMKGVNTNNQLVFKGVSPSVLKTLLTYTYTSKLEINSDNAIDMLRLSCRLRHTTAIRKCSDFLKSSINCANCLSIQEAASSEHCEYLNRMALKFALRNFKEVIKQKAFVDMPVKQLVRYLGDNSLNVHAEQEVFDALSIWVNHNMESRSKHISEILICVRLLYVNPIYLKQTILQSELIVNNVECEKVVSKAVDIHQQIREGRTSTDMRKNPRRSYGEVTVVVGGRNKNGEWMNDVWFYDHVKRKWIAMSPLPSGNEEYKVISHCNDIYAIGGRNKSGNVVSEVWRYDSLFDEWTQTEDLLAPRISHGVGILFDKIFVVGGRDGYSGESTSEVEKFSRSNNEWKNGEPMTYGVMNPVVVSHSRRLYIIGGRHEDSNILFQCFHHDKNTWTVMSHTGLLYEPRIAATIKNKIYLVGGKQEYSVQIYDPNKDKLTAAGEMPHAEAHARELYSGTTTNKKLIVTGGHWAIGTADDALIIVTNSVEQYDPVTNDWTVLGPMPRALSQHACVAIKRFIGLPMPTSWSSKSPFHAPTS